MTSSGRALDMAGGTGGDEAGQKRGSQAEVGVDQRVVEPVRCAVQAATAGRKVWS
jgi:hypothetical protein